MEETSASSATAADLPRRHDDDSLSDGGISFLTTSMLTAAPTQCSPLLSRLLDRASDRAPDKASDRTSRRGKQTARKPTHRQRHLLHLQETQYTSIEGSSVNRITIAHTAGNAEATSATTINANDALTSTLPRTLAAPTPRRMRNTTFKKPFLLLASLGNPSPYSNTPHSAGHILLAALLASLSLPPLSPARSTAPWLGKAGGGRVSNAMPSLEQPWTGFASGSLMNVSGKGIADAWRGWTSRLPSLNDNSPPPRLVLLHDELEAPWGKVKLKIGGSARGHNGVKSVMQALPGLELVRIAVGVGRPLSRDSDDVARYVLRQMTREELDLVRGCVGDTIKLLEKL